MKGFSSDHDYDARLKLLWELMEVSPEKPVRKLLRESLKYYPLKSIALQRYWLSMRTAFACCDRFDPLGEIYRKKETNEQCYGLLDLKEDDLKEIQEE